MSSNEKIHNFYNIDDELRDRLMNLHHKLTLALDWKDTSLSLNKEEITDICKFMNTFLYD